MDDTDEVLLNKINAAVADHNAAEKAVTTAQSELVSKSKTRSPRRRIGKRRCGSSLRCWPT
jgi:hypothetical protein